MPNPISAAKVQQIKSLARQGHRTKEIARHTGLSDSTVHKVRQGYYDHRLGRKPPANDDGDARVAAWCERCRAHVYPPCQSCHVREYERRQSAGGSQRRQPALLPEIHSVSVLHRLRMSVAEIGLPVRAVNYLQQRQILTVNDLLHQTPGDLLRIPNFAAKTLEHVYRCLARLGFSRRTAT
jgi:hypothetical protein